MKKRITGGLMAVIGIVLIRVWWDLTEFTADPYIFCFGGLLLLSWLICAALMLTEGTRLWDILSRLYMDEEDRDEDE